MREYIWETAEDIDKALADRVRRIRRRRNISQERLAAISGVSHGSVKRFETTGQISLLSLTKIAMALGCIDEIKGMFSQVPYLNIEEVLSETK